MNQKIVLFAITTVTFSLLLSTSGLVSVFADNNRNNHGDNKHKNHNNNDRNNDNKKNDNENDKKVVKKDIEVDKKIVKKDVDVDRKVVRKDIDVTRNVVHQYNPAPEVVVQPPAKQVTENVNQNINENVNIQEQSQTVYHEVVYVDRPVQEVASYRSHAVYPVQNVKSTPETGAAEIALLSIPSMAGAGLFLRRKFTI